MNTISVLPKNFIEPVLAPPSLPMMNLSDINDDGVDPEPVVLSPLDPTNEKDRERLAQRIARRPSKADLKLRNIIRMQSLDSVIPQNNATQAQLQPASSAIDLASIKDRSNKLRSCLKKRPERQELMDKHILRMFTNTGAPVAAEQLRRAQISNALESRLAVRPNPDELSSRLLKFDESVEVLPTFRRAEYNRKPDTNSTFRKLTPKLKMEIREELNSFKRDEMSVHSESTKNTAFH